MIEGAPEDLDRIMALHNRDQNQDEEIQNNLPRPARTPGFRRMGSIGLAQNGNFKWSKRLLVKLLKLSEIEQAKEVV